MYLDIISRFHTMYIEYRVQQCIRFKCCFNVCLLADFVFGHSSTFLIINGACYQFHFISYVNLIWPTRVYMLQNLSINQPITESREWPLTYFCWRQMPGRVLWSAAGRVNPGNIPWEARPHRENCAPHSTSRLSRNQTPRAAAKYAQRLDFNFDYFWCCFQHMR